MQCIEHHPHRHHHREFLRHLHRQQGAPRAQLASRHLSSFSAGPRPAPASPDTPPAPAQGFVLLDVNKDSMERIAEVIASLKLQPGRGQLAGRASD
jgi:hypothetical protein